MTHGHIFPLAQEKPLFDEHPEMPDPATWLRHEKDDITFFIFLPPQLLQVMFFPSSELNTSCSKQLPQLLHLYSYIGIYAPPSYFPNISIIYLCSTAGLRLCDVIKTIAAIEGWKFKTAIFRPKIRN